MTILRSQLDLATSRPSSARVARLPAGAAIERVPWEGSFAWALNPYGAPEGLLPQLARIGCAELVSHAPPPARAPAVQALLGQLADVAARQDRTFSERPLLLGTEQDPWPAAEREGRLTRSILEGLASLRRVQLHAMTRSSLVGRDADVLATLARRGKVRVTVLLPGIARKSWMALEPHAPSPERRLMAIALLARARIEVGIEVTPLLRGFNDASEDFLPTLERARAAGASFATARPLELSEAARERVLGLAEQHDPVRAPALRRLLIHPHLHDARSWADARARFVKACEHLGLQPFPGEKGSSPAPAPKARQLSLF